jgi:uncharacterized protein YgiM (DUF1202 family)
MDQKKTSRPKSAANTKPVAKDELVPIVGVNGAGKNPALITSVILAPREPKFATVTSSGQLNLRKSPTTDSKVLCRLDKGAKLMVEDTRDNWAHVYTSSGLEGYVMSQYIKEDVTTL